MRSLSELLGAKSQPAGEEPSELRSDSTGGGTTSPPPRGLESHLEAARRVALPMAAAGRSRAEVEAHLRSVFGLDDPTQILDSVFGAGEADPRERRA